MQSELGATCDLAWTRLALARALEAAGQPGAAEDELADAGQLFERAGMRTGSALAATLRQQLASRAA
jgi:hypothetical protein